MSEEVLDSSADAGTGERPVFLTVLCILSFVAAGLGILAYIAAFAAMGLVESASSAVTANGGTVSGPGTGIIWAYIIVGFATTIVGLVGVIKMWKLQKSGFMLYAGATVVSVIMGIIYSGFGASIVSIVISAGFIVMYQMNTKAMK